MRWIVPFPRAGHIILALLYCHISFKHSNYNYTESRHHYNLGNSQRDINESLYPHAKVQVYETILQNLLPVQEEHETSSCAWASCAGHLLQITSHVPSLIENDICRCVLHYIASWTLCMRNGELCRLRGAGWLVWHWNLSWISRCSTSRKNVTLICHLGFDLCASMAATILKQGVPHVCDGLLNIFTVITKLNKMMLVVWCWLLHRF